MTTSPTGAATFSNRWVTYETVEMHQLVFAMIASKGLVHLAEVLALIAEIERPQIQALPRAA